MMTDIEFKNWTGLTYAEYAQLMEEIQSALIDKLLLMVEENKLTQDQYDEILNYTSTKVSEKCPHWIPPIPLETK